MFCVDVPGGLHNILSAVCILALHVRVICKFAYEVPLMWHQSDASYKCCHYNSRVRVVYELRQSRIGQNTNRDGGPLIIKTRNKEEEKKHRRKQFDF